MWDRGADEFDRYLEPAERLLWTGQPRQGIVFRSSDVFLIPFSVVWAGFAVFWLVMALRAGAPFWFAIWGVPFVLVGLYITVGRFLADARLRARTYYALTDKRIIVASGFFTSVVRSIGLDALPQTELTEKPDGTGTIVFGPQHPFMGFYRGSEWPGMSRHATLTFEMIEDARAVNRRIEEARTALLQY